MKKLGLFLLLSVFCASFAFAQEKEEAKKEDGYKFTDLKVIPVTSVKRPTQSRYLLVLFRIGLH